MRISGFRHHLLKNTGLNCTRLHYTIELLDNALFYQKNSCILLYSLEDFLFYASILFKISCIMLHSFKDFCILLQSVILAPSLLCAIKFLHPSLLCTIRFLHPSLLCTENSCTPLYSVLKFLHPTLICTKIPAPFSTLY